MSKSDLKNKKAQLLGTGTNLFITTAVIILLILIFYLWINILGKPVTADLEKSSIETQALTSLRAYLETPVNVNVNGRMQEMPIADLIRLAEKDSSHIQALDERTRDIFDAVYGPLNWKLQVFHSSGPAIVVPTASNLVPRISQRMVLEEDLTVILYLS